MLVLQKAFRNVCYLIMLITAPLCAYSEELPLESEEIESELTDPSIFTGTDLFNKSMSFSSHRHKKQLLYYLYIADFIPSFISIPTSNVSTNPTTLESSYLAGRAPLYSEDNIKVGTCSASFLNMKNADGIFTDISNFISVDNGLIVTWFTPTRLLNLELDSMLHSMVTECIVVASTKVGVNPYYGLTFNLIVSSDNEKIYFMFTKPNN